MAPEREGIRLRDVRWCLTALAPEKGGDPPARCTLVPDGIGSRKGRGPACGEDRRAPAYSAHHRSEVEITGGIVVGNILDHLMNERHLAFRQSAFLDILSENGTEYSAEIFMTRI